MDYAMVYSVLNVVSVLAGASVLVLFFGIFKGGI